MNGIMTNDFDLLLRQNASVLIEVASDLAKVQGICSELSLNLKSKDLDFMKSKLDLEINQLGKALNKLNAYQNTLKSVRKEYQKQYDQIVKTTKKLIS